MLEILLVKLLQIRRVRKEMSENTRNLIETKDLSNILRQKKGLLNRNPSVVKAVDHVSLSVRKGEHTGPGRRVTAAENHSGKNYFSA